MKRIVVLFLAVWFVGLAAKAQVRVLPRFGVHVAGVDAQIRDFETEARTGYNLGVDFRIGGGMVSLQPGFHYYVTSAGMVQDPDRLDDFRLTDETTIHAYKTPLSLLLNLFGNNGVLDVHVSGSVVPTFLRDVRQSEVLALEKQDLNHFTLGAGVGAGVDLFFLSFDLRYEMGLSDFYAEAPGRNNVLTANLGFRF